MKSILLVCFVVGLVGVVKGQNPSIPPECLKIPDKNPMECCQLPKLMDPAIFTKCEAEFGAKKADVVDVFWGCCVSECVLNATKINVNGALDKEVAKKVLKADLGTNPEWGPIIDTAIDTCLAEAASKETEFKTKPTGAKPEDKMCCPLSGFLIGCVHANLFINCPKFTANDECNQLKTLLIKCPKLLMDAKPK